jgi:hypothetical protein
MDKRHAIQIMTKAAEIYRDNLEDQKVLFLYGTPSEVKKQLQTEEKILLSIQGYEVAFHRYNFLHLTGVRLNKNSTASAIHFYQKCLDKRLKEDDFSLAKDGSTGQKLDILESMMLIKKNVTMIGEFTRQRTEIVCRKGGRKCVWVYWFCAGQKYKTECAKYAVEKGYKRCNGTTYLQGVCCNIKILYRR